MKIEELFQQEDVMLYEMANFYPKKTGLSTVIFFGEVGGQHGPRIKVSNVRKTFSKFDNFTITVDKQPQVIHPEKAKLNKDEIEDIIDWIKLNYEKLMWLWKFHETGDDVEVIMNGVVHKLDNEDIEKLLQRL